MLADLSVYLPVLFTATTFAQLAWFTAAVRQARHERVRHRAGAMLLLLLSWLAVQAALSLMQFYADSPTQLPPRFGLAIGPPLLALVVLLATARGRAFMDSLPVVWLTYGHAVRVPVELTLYGLFRAGAVPELMTFEGRNFDILAGLSAPLVAYAWQRGWLRRRGLLLWNGVALGLVLNIVVNAILAAPSPIQQQAFEQPNVAILYFPFSWLPAFVVPLVLLSHVAAIRQLVRDKR